MCSLQGREQAFWKVLGTPGHVAERLLVASLGLCIIRDVSVYEWGGVAQGICPQGRGYVRRKDLTGVGFCLLTSGSSFPGDPHTKVPITCLLPGRCPTFCHSALCWLVLCQSDIK